MFYYNKFYLDIDVNGFSFKFPDERIQACDDLFLKRSSKLEELKVLNFNLNKVL